MPSSTLNRMILALAATAACVLSAPGLVHAEKSAPKAEVIRAPLELYDTNEDGYVSAEEAAQQKMPARTFESLDVDRDGRLNKDEFGKAPPMRLDEEVSK
ncbi:EF-hand domain-containing protein [Nitrosospira sp. Nsp2]|uniref:EF-hand domain-containing protein n=1 Tax=Nitrosospira sp. Nsp2 TaxID=136548 RepID=UPI000D3201CD|nr:EF-hand domain-containing protein [Nitrosospira sp. Nsp2]